MKLKTLVQKKENDYSSSDEQIKKILYVSPNLNNEGYYRSIIPYLELSKYGIATEIIDIKRWDFTKTYSLDDLKISRAAIEWADYIIFKSLTEDYRYFFKAMKRINPKVKLVTDIAHPLHGLPNHHPAHYKIDRDAQQNFILNLSQMDMVTSHNSVLLHSYQYLIKKQEAEHSIKFLHIPNFISLHPLDTLKAPKKEDINEIRIGIYTDTMNYHDVLLLKNVLQKLKAHYKDYIQIILIGWNGKLPTAQEPLKDVITSSTNVSFLDFYQSIQNLQLDMMLLPMIESNYNSYRSNISYLDCSILKIPVIASKSSIYNSYIKSGVSGILAHSDSDWIEAIQLLVENPSIRKQISNATFRISKDLYGFSDSYLKLFF